MVNALLVLALATTPSADPSTALKKYVSTPDSTYSWSKSAWKGHDALRLKSQTWQGRLWEHDVVLCRPRHGGQSHTWVLHVTGSDPNDFDVDWSQGLADQSGCPVAILFHIPNQPIFELKEDDLIAHTFEKYIETGDETWPLLFPMVKSAVKTMDAVQAYDHDAKKFVVFGASKRGWTSWLTAASGDRRVAGIAPMLFDNLKIPQQLAKQMKDWGEYSPMIQDYTKRHLEDTVASEIGQKLIQMVDPASYLSSIKVPVMLINGSNDPYWTVDALSLYWDDIKSPKWLVTVPNLGHAFEKTDWWTPSLAAFARMCSGGPKLPNFTEKDKTGDLGAWLKKWGFVRATEWQAVSKDRHFSQAVWHPVDVQVQNGKFVMGNTLPQPGFTAHYFDAEFRQEGISFHLTGSSLVKHD